MGLTPPSIELPTNWVSALSQWLLIYVKNVQTLLFPTAINIPSIANKLNGTWQKQSQYEWLFYKHSRFSHLKKKIIFICIYVGICICLCGGHGVQKIGSVMSSWKWELVTKLRFSARATLLTT